MTSTLDDLRLDDLKRNLRMLEKLKPTDQAAPLSAGFVADVLRERGRHTVRQHPTFCTVRRLETMSHEPPHLLPCPFCAREARFEKVSHDPFDNNYGGEYVECSNCGASTKLWFPLKEDVKRQLLEAWNRRASTRRLADALAGMVGLVQLVKDRYRDFPVDNHRVIEAMSALNEHDLKFGTYIHDSPAVRRKVALGT